jgi:hypothetical protein
VPGGVSDNCLDRSSFREIRAEHNHHRVTDLLRELLSTHFIAWRYLGTIARIANLGAEWAESGCVIESLSEEGIYWSRRIKRRLITWSSGIRLGVG